MSDMHSPNDSEFLQRLKQEAVETDREDLLAILTLRFGGVPENIQGIVESLTNAEKLERLVLVAANVPTLNKFVEELHEGSEAFRLVGEGFNPLAEQ
ncbi:hypothetical protein [Alicyclobacillus mengziensis]|nr:hypothetical protein [Alicyclobacillus mengziensis]